MHIDEPAAFLVKGKKVYRIVAHNADTGALRLETEYGVIVTTTAQEAERNGYTATEGVVRKSLNVSRVAYEFRPIAMEGK